MHARPRWLPGLGLKTLSPFPFIQNDKVFPAQKWLAGKEGKGGKGWKGVEGCQGDKVIRGERVVSGERGKRYERR